MFTMIMKIMFLLIILAGAVLIYDARILTKRFFGFGDQNEGTAGLKILGFILTIIGGVILFFVLKWKHINSIRHI